MLTQEEITLYTNVARKALREMEDDWNKIMGRYIEKYVQDVYQGVHVGITISRFVKSCVNQGLMVPTDPPNFVDLDTRGREILNQLPTLERYNVPGNRLDYWRIKGDLD